MKKFLLTLLALSLALAMLFAFTACGDEDGNDNSQVENNQSNNSQNDNNQGDNNQGNNNNSGTDQGGSNQGGNSGDVNAHQHAVAFTRNENVVDPTCLVAGSYDEVAYCSCGYVLSRTPVTTTALGHSAGVATTEDNVAPTCLESGSYDSVIYCTRCDLELMRVSQTVSALGHDHVQHDAVDPTCTAIGWDAYESCSRCDYTTYVERAALDHDTVAHKAKAPTCTEIGWYAYETCSRCDYTTYVERAAFDHTESEAAIENNVDPDCENDGSYDSVVYCSVCDAELSRETVTVAALGHTIVTHDAKAPTCAEIGWDSYETCSRCDYTTYNKKSPLPHAYLEENIFECRDCGHINPGSEGLSYYEIHDGNTVIGYSVSKGICTDDTVVIPKEYIGKPVVEVNAEAFKYSAIKKVFIPDSVTYIGDWAFIYCTNLTNIIIPDSVTSIGNYAFSGCKSLTSIVIPDSMETLGSYAFCVCSNLSEITIGKSLVTIGEAVFYNCTSLTSIVIPDSVETLGEHAFAYCSQLSEITLGESLASISSHAFQGCSNLKSVTIPNNVTSIDAYVFYDCSNLKSVTIGNRVTSIGSDAFALCTRLAIINYCGTEAEWDAISKGNYWDYSTGNYTIIYNYTKE